MRSVRRLPSQCAVKKIKRRRPIEFDIVVSSSSLDTHTHTHVVSIVRAARPPLRGWSRSGAPPAARLSPFAVRILSENRSVRFPEARARNTPRHDAGAAPVHRSAVLVDGATR